MGPTRVEGAVDACAPSVAAGSHRPAIRCRLAQIRSPAKPLPNPSPLTRSHAPRLSLFPISPESSLSSFVDSAPSVTALPC
ncbi:hypothetical protein TRIUR3_08057 [Triticum urartu]|uniref:Uncharacterized protein n=1 Tax=Triticum urartu TaxID=4572 RepID=M7YYB3_TRIUA|nr:hypothetical protein TRIUR3_08057 [Triticum urartu]